MTDATPPGSGTGGHQGRTTAPTGQSPDDGIGESITQILALQQRLRRRMQDALAVDAAGLNTMIHLAGVGSDSPTAIAGNLQASTAATSLVLNRLEAAGHVSRRPHPDDRRKVVVAPAPQSLAAAYEVVRPIIDGIDQASAALTPAERSTVAEFLAAVVQVYEEALGDGTR